MEIDREAARGEPEVYKWTLPRIVFVVVLFVAAAAFEVGGGWLIWEAIREQKPAYAICPFQPCTWDPHRLCMLHLFQG